MIGRTRVISSTIAGLLMFTLMVRAQETLGTPGVDYPDYYSIPRTSFSCSEQKYFPGFYADLETKCQVFHLCLKDRQESFLCPTGATYNQAKLTCDSWYSSNCSLAPSFYNVNSGPIMESASQSIPMLIKLRNRSQKRQSLGLSTANVYEKIASLFEGTADEPQSSTETSNLAKDVNVESNQEFNREVRSDEFPTEIQEASENEWQLNEDLLSGMNVEIPTGEYSQDGVYYQDTLGEEAEENMDTGIFYNPVTEQYYIDYNTQNEWQRDPEDYDFSSVYDYDSLVNEYIALDEYVERLRNSENKISTASVDDLEEFNEMLDTVETNEKLLGRMIEADHPLKRLRRKPLYTTVQRDEIEFPGVSVKYPVLNADKTESVQADSEVSSEHLEDIVTESAEMEDEADTDAPIQISDELRIPNFTPLNVTEVPLTAQEFSARIIHELVEPKIEELDLRLISFHPTDEDRNEESSESESHDIQSDDQYSFVEKLPLDGYESYSTDYNGDIVIVERPDSDQGIPDEEKANLYHSGERYSVEDEVVEDTFVVIPDESEGGDSEESSDTNEQASTLDDSSYDSMENDEQNQSDVPYDSYDALRDYFLSRYASTAEHASINPYRFQTPEFYFPNEYGRQRSYMHEGLHNTESRELLQSPYPYEDHSGEANDQQTGYAYEDSRARYYPFVEPGSYVYEQPASFEDYTYGTENGYSYGEVNGYYDNGYDKDHTNFGYEASDIENSETLDETPYLNFNPDYSQPGIPSWIQSDSIENSENEQLGVSDNSSPTEDYLADSFDTFESGSETSEMSVPEDVSFEDENMKQDEIYYLLDFEEDNKEKAEFQSDGNAESLELDSEQLDLKEFFTKGKHWQLDEPSEVSDINVVSQSQPTETAEETLFPEKDSDSKNVNMKSPDVSESTANTRARTDSWSFQSTESTQVNEKPVTLSSVLEQLAGLNTVKTSGGSVVPSINLPRNKLNSMPFPESVEFVPSGVANGGQQYRITDASTLLSTDNLLSHRTGNFQQPSSSRLSAIQERIRTLKQGKFGAFKKYINSAERKE